MRLATNAMVGFRKGGITKVAYNHRDSYVRNGFGEEILNLLKVVDKNKMVQCFDNIQIIDSKNFHNTDSDLRKYITGEANSMVDGDNNKSEYNYIIDLDNQELEINHYNVELRVSFNFIDENSIPYIIEFIEISMLEHLFDKEARDLESELSNAFLNNNYAFLGRNNLYSLGFEVDSENLTQEELEEQGGPNLENNTYLLVYLDHFNLSESLVQKAKDLVKRVEKNLNIKVLVESGYHMW